MTSKHLGTKSREGGLIRGLGAAFNSAPLRKYGSIDKCGSTPLITATETDIEARIIESTRRLSDLSTHSKTIDPSKKEIIDLRGLERFDAPANLSPAGSWLGGITGVTVEAPLTSVTATTTIVPSSSIRIGSPGDTIKEFKKRLSRNGSSSSESDVSESYQKRMLERAIKASGGSNDNLPGLVHTPVASIESPMRVEVKETLLSPPPAVPTSQGVKLDGIALATRDRRLRRPLKARESDSVLPPDE